MFLNVKKKYIYLQIFTTGRKIKKIADICPHTKIYIYTSSEQKITPCKILAKEWCQIQTDCLPKK